MNIKGEQSKMMLQNHRLSDLVSSYSRGGFAFRDYWLYEMDLVHNNLADMNAPSRKKSNPAKLLYSFTESPSGQRWRVRKSDIFLNPRKVKKTAPEMSKTIVAIKRYNDSLYILGDLCSSARSRPSSRLKKTKHVNNCYSARCLGDE